MKKMPFIFISAAEAGWTFPAPVPFLEKYLQAKRKVEAYLQSKPTLRPVIFRPSLIWTKERPQALLSVIPFYIGSALGLPFVDRPVVLESLVQACMRCIEDNSSESGIKRWQDIERLAGERVD